MRESGSAATCLPVMLDAAAWEAALFVQVSGPESRDDRGLLRRARDPLPVGFEADLVENEHAAVVVLRLEVFTRPQDPLVFEILLLPGGLDGHFEALKLLASQARLCWLFCDQDFKLIHSQQHSLGAEQHASFEELLRDAVRHDSLLRCMACYDGRAALTEIVEHYELRPGVIRAPDSAASENTSTEPSPRTRN